MLIEARRDKGVELRENHRTGEKRRGENRHPDLGEKIFLRRRIDQPRVRAGRVFEGNDQNIVDVLGEKEADDEHHDEGERAP